MTGEIVAAVIADIMSGFGLSAGGSAGSVALASWQNLVNRRLDTAREILLDELRRGETFLTQVPEEDLAAITFRYSRAAVEGAARLNLRLMAAVASGQIQQRGLYADQFLRQADVLASLRREEILILGEFIRHTKSLPTDSKERKVIWDAVKESVLQKHAMQESQARAYAVACMRTGLLSLEEGPWVESMLPVATDDLLELQGIADIIGVLRRHDAQA